MENVREIVLDILLTLEREGGYSNKLIKDVLDKYDYLERSQKAFIKRVTEGTIERKIELDYYLNHFSNTPVNKMKPLIRCLMRMSVYQLLYMDQVPDSAVCNEACKLAQKRKFVTLKGFVNGVLRTISKNKDSLPLPQKTNIKEYLSVKYSMPLEVLEVLLEAYGEELTEEIIDSLLQIHPVSIRLKDGLSESEKEQVLEELRVNQIQIKESAYSGKLYQLENVDNLARLDSFVQGLFTVQDSSSVLAVQSAQIEQGTLVVDACAAPGGKSMIAGQYAKQVYAFDVSEDKCYRMQDNMERMGLSNVVCEVHDAREPKEELLGKADVLLLDVPCSGLGILGKKRDIKYHFNKEELIGLYSLQKEIVEKSLEYLKPGGTLLYSTCTINPKENQDMVAYIEQRPEMESVSILECIPDKLRKEYDTVQEKLQRAGKKPLPENSVLCLPGTMEMDGFFFAKFRKTEA